MKYKSLITSLVALSSFLIFSQNAYAASYINVSSGSGGTVSLGSIKPSSTGVSASGSDTLTITTNCSAGYSVYVSGQEGKGTSLTNPSTSTNNTISASETAVGSVATTLNSNTWGITGDSTNASASKYVGLPAYADATSMSLITTSFADTSGDNKNTIYYGVKVDATLTPGTYSGDVLYTTLVSDKCNNYTVKFNANGGTGTMSDQTIPVGAATSLTMNKFTRAGYMFLGWGTSSSAAEPTYKDGEKVTDVSDFNTIITLYALWGQSTGNMQDFECTKLASGATTYLTDARDNQVYSVYRIPTDQTYAGTSTIANIAGKCLMTKDLSLGYVTGGSITKGSNLVLSTDTSAGSTTSSESVVFVDAANNGSGWNTDNTDANLQYTNGPRSEYETYSNHSYYSFGAAQKVCPRGWRLPTGDEYGNNTTSSSVPTIGLAAIVNNNTDGSTALQSYPWNFTLGGNFFSIGWDNQGLYGHYWSSTQDSSANGRYLRFSMSVVYLNSNSKRDGRSVRCIAEDNYTISYSSAGAGTGEPSTTSEVAYESGSITMSTVGTMKKDGYDFKGWALTSGTTEATYTADQTVTVSDLLIAASSAGQTTAPGSTVVLYPVWAQSVSYMQDFSCSSLASGGTTTLTDKRDGNTYGIYRIPVDAVAENVAGKCIMTENLKLGYDPVAGKILSSITVNSTTSNYDTTAPSTVAEPFVLSGDYTITHSSTASDYSDGSYSSRLFTYDTSNKRYGYYTWGAAIVACPKGWRLPLTEEYGTTGDTSTTHTAGVGMIVGNSATGSTTIRKSPWSFVYGGRLNSDGWHYKGTIGYYWSSGTDGFQGLQFYGSYVRLSGISRQQAASIRCIADDSSNTIKDITYLQEVTSPIVENTPSGATATLIDSRDGQAYSVYKIPSNSIATDVAGKLIMTRDLNLGAMESTSGASSSIVAKGTMTLNSDDSNFDTNASGTGTNGETFSLSGDQTIVVGYSSSKNTYTQKTYHVNSKRGYYSWGAALVACPKGWRLPTADEYGITTGIAYATDRSFTTITSNPWSFELGGHYYLDSYWISGTGRYWSSTQTSATQASRLVIGSSNNIGDTSYLTTMGGYNKSTECPIRCISD